MECVEGTFKTSFEENGDDFFVDDLLNFSNEDCFVEEDEPEQEPEEEEDNKGFDSVSPSLLNPNQTEEQDNSIPVTSTSFSTKHQFGPVPNNNTTTELSVPVDELANLEWLSHFVEDSFSEFSTPYLAGTGGVSSENPKNQTEKIAPEPQMAKKPKKKLTQVGHATNPANPTNPAGQPSRRCSHCGVQKTPQWRTGPLGAKTLCNACGVRFKSGRLLPEYRPACSPTFSSELHSNHHRKVLEMRRKKEDVPVAESGFVVPSF
ncbi:hypothetical protein F8388_009286 [Cannabis sativa]|uniref:GATA transcription factor n=1 Tax=Cannabis sativa TaxID=3483 RepID=A0A7J6GJZ7_CANSA|nr:hypothetical protein G4B88_016967 [Cannabis sativa]KAF4383255.1 hypothetical protein F8388_009286 [Cannabis sativa]